METSTITLAGGCFWCTEAIYKRIKGVTSVVPGYANSNIKNPTYEDVSNGKTGSQEAVQLVFDQNIVSFQKLLEIFFKTHDPTTFDKQGADTGSQYRSVVFYTNENQKTETLNVIKKLSEAKVFNDKIVTEVKPLENFSEAEAYHKNYFERNQTQPYCAIVINPKLDKLYKEFPSELK